MTSSLTAMLLAAAPDLSAQIAKHPERTFRELGNDFHDDMIDFIHRDVPKLLVIFLMAFLLSRVLAFFVGRMRKVADRQVGNARRGAQMRTLASILRAAGYTVIGFVTIEDVARAHPETIWEKHRSRTGVDHASFKAYFNPFDKLRSLQNL